ncbi:MAG: SirB2 family protein [Rhodanobacter sp.]
MTLVEFYPAIKTAHIGLVLASGGLFVLRGLGVIFERNEAMRASVRYLSYGIDTALLAAALLLLAILHLNPFTTPWLIAKLALLVTYIVLGSLAFRRTRTRSRRVMAFVAALLCFGAMYSIARRHDPLGFMDWFLR